MNYHTQIKLHRKEYCSFLTTKEGLIILALLIELKFQYEYNLVWFRGNFRRKNEERNNYIFWTGLLRFTSISVDWMQTGNAPEDEICSIDPPENSGRLLSICDGIHAALMLILLLGLNC
uniref:Uncharacterized protein n=1 Tax=Schistocephalus solidus TaxID=70667 RepID=A0A0X3QDN1_SCHSO